MKLVKFKTFLRSLTVEQRRQVKINTIEQCGKDFWSYMLTRQQQSRYDFMAGVFTWETTPEGYDYWSKIAQQFV